MGGINGLVRIGVVVFAALLVSALSAASALASSWEIESTKLVSGSSESVTCKKVGEPSLRFQAGPLLPPPEEEFDFRFTTAECLESKITQSGSEATGDTSLKLTGVSVLKPSGCVMTSASFFTPHPLKSKLVEVGTTVYKVLEPKEGTVLFQFTLEKCTFGFSNTYKVVGALCGEASKTGVQSVEQPVKYSEAIEKAAGCSLKIGSVVSHLSGEVASALSGKNAGKKWGAVE